MFIKYWVRNIAIFCTEKRAGNQIITTKHELVIVVVRPTQTLYVLLHTTCNADVTMSPSPVIFGVLKKVTILSKNTITTLFITGGDSHTCSSCFAVLQFLQEDTAGGTEFNGHFRTDMQQNFLTCQCPHLAHTVR